MKIAVDTDSLSTYAQSAADGADGINNATPDVHFSSLATLLPGSVSGGGGDAVARRVNVLKANLYKMADGYARGLKTASTDYSDVEASAQRDFSLSYTPSTASETATAQSSSGYQAGSY